MLFNDRRNKARNPANQGLVDQAMNDIKVARSNTKMATANAKSAMKAVKKAGANTPEFKAIMKGNYDGR
jgi:ribosome maturation protein Sdo1